MIYEDNTLYVDIENLSHKLTLTPKHYKRIRLFMGKIHSDGFEITVDTINKIPDEKQFEIRNYIRSIFKK